KERQSLLSLATSPLAPQETRGYIKPPQEAHLVVQPQQLERLPFKWRSVYKPLVPSPGPPPNAEPRGWSWRLAPRPRKEPIGCARLLIPLAFCPAPPRTSTRSTPRLSEPMSIRNQLRKK